MSEEKVKYRFPGAQPFEKNQDSIFFGRDEAIKKLYRTIKINPLVVLQGKSGVGKSSMINAGFIPFVNNDKRYETVTIRFRSYMETEGTPFEKTGYAIRENRKIVTTFLDKVIKNEASLWHDIKEHQITHPEKQGVILIFDQFEELFTYPRKEIELLAIELSEILNTSVPQRYWDILDKYAEEGRSPISPDELEIFYRRPVVNILFVIRYDKLHLLSYLDDYLPGTLRNCFELVELSEADARKAISGPAGLDNIPINLECKPFKFSHQAILKIMDFLTLDGRENVDTTHLQIVCHHFEQQQIKDYKPIIEVENLGDLEKIIENYYESKINSLENQKSRDAARRLIEDLLVYAPEKRRISLFSGVIVDFLKENGVNMPRTLINDLENIRLLRAEATERGTYYELSHDRLVNPVLKFKAVHDKQIRAKEQMKMKEDLREERKSRARWRNLALVALLLFAITVGLGIYSVIKDSELQETQKNLKTRYEQIINADQSRINHIFTQIEEEITKLKYEEAWSNLKRAALLAARDPEKLTNDYFEKTGIELGIYFIESGLGDTVVQILNVLSELDPTLEQKFKLASVDSFHPLLKDLNPGYYETVIYRYFPEMVVIKGGTYTMGLDSSLIKKYNRTWARSPHSKEKLYTIDSSDILEKFAHRVSLSDFSIARTTTTIRQYDLFCKATGYEFPEELKKYFFGIIPSGELPMMEVSWLDAARYTNWLNNKRGLDSIYSLNSKDYLVKTSTGWGKAYRLPTEAEWEYVAKGGQFLNALDPYLFSGSDIVDSVGVLKMEPAQDAYIFPEIVKSKSPNQLGIYDMTGNVWEWVFDFYGDYDKTLQTNPRGPEKPYKEQLNYHRVLKGGSARQYFKTYTNTMRYGRKQSYKDAIRGFRVAKGI